MIVAEQKSIAEIKEIVAPYKKILLLGCGTCVKTCFAGGEDEVAVMASALRLAVKVEGRDIEIEELTVERQCEDEFIQESAEAIARNESVLSLACGAGVQALARRFKTTPVLPGANTTFMGVLEKPGLQAGSVRWGLSVYPLRQKTGERPLRRLAQRQVRDQPGYRLRLASDHRAIDGPGTDEQPESVSSAQELVCQPFLRAPQTHQRGS